MQQADRGVSPCEICGGACCESIVLPWVRGDTKTEAWLSVRGERIDRETFALESRCKHLTNKGACGIHEQKPDICREYPIGGRACLAAIARRRIVDAGRIIEAIEALFSSEAHEDLRTGRD